MPGLEPTQLAEVLGTDAVGSFFYGSGYRISRLLVLTCGHILPETGTSPAPAASIKVRLGGGAAGKFPASVAWNGWPDRDIDLALLRIEDQPGLGPAVPVRLGYFPVRGADFLAGICCGYPRCAERPDGRRDSRVARGEFSLASNNKSGLLSFVLGAGEPRDSGDEPESQWHGISGGPAFSGEFLVAVVTDNLPANGTGVLDATLVSAALEEHDFRAEIVADGLADPVAVPGAGGPKTGGGAEFVATALRIAALQWPPESYLLPPNGDPRELHQPVRVRTRQQDRPRWSGVTGDDRPEAEAGQDAQADHDDGLVWEPTQVMWPSVWVRGGPGYGKTWLLRYHAATLAEAGLARLAESQTHRDVMIPVYVQARRLGARLPEDPAPDEVYRELAGQLIRDAQAGTGLRVEDMAELVSDAVRGSRLVVCLDALDEVPGAYAERVDRAVARLETDGCRLVVSTRLGLGSAPTGQRTEVEVTGFATTYEVRQFARAWFGVGTEGAQRVETALADPRIRELARVPLLAAIICYLQRPGHSDRSVPATRTHLVREAALSLLRGDVHGSEARRLTDHNYPPDPRLRLKALADAVGTLATAWRSRVEPIDRQELDRLLSEHQSGSRLANASAARYRRYERSQAGVPPDMVWEYVFDNILLEDEDADGRRQLRFIHGLFRSLCLAEHLASLDPEVRWQTVDVHRWFDREWVDVIPMAAELSDGRDDLVRRLLTTENDAFYEQRLLAGRCVAADPKLFASDIVDQVVAATDQAVASRQWLDRVHGLDVLRALIRGRCAPAADLGHRLRSDAETPKHVRDHVVVSLAQARDPDGLAAARELVADAKARLVDRTAAAEALVVADGAAGVGTVCAVLKGERQSKVRSALSTSLASGDEHAVAAALDFTRSVGPPTGARGEVAVALAAAGAIGNEVGADILSCGTLSWAERAAVGAALIRGGKNPGPVLRKLAHNPNLPGVDRAELAIAWAQRGAQHAVGMAGTLLRREDLDWQVRQRLARAVARLGQEGQQSLRKFAADAQLPAAVRLRAIDALAEVADPKGIVIAVGLVESPRVRVWVRQRLAAALLRRGQALPGDVIGVLATADTAHRLEVVQTLALNGDSRAQDLGFALLRDKTTKTSGMMQATLGIGADVAELAQSGPPGVAALRKFASDASVPVAARQVAVTALVLADPAGADAAPRLVEPGPLRTRLALALARAGSPQAFTPLLELLPGAEYAYAPLYQLLSSPTPGITLQMIRQARRAVVDPPSRTQRSPVKLGQGFLSSHAIPFRSPAEAEEISLTIYRETEMSVGFILAGRMIPQELEEFERAIDVGDEGLAFALLESTQPDYQEVVSRELDRITEEHRVLLGTRPRNLLPVERLARITAVATALEAWIRFGRQPGAINLAASHHAALSTPILGRLKEEEADHDAKEILYIAERHTREWPVYRAHSYLLTLAFDVGWIPAYEIVVNASALLDRLRRQLAAGSGALVEAGGGLAALVTPDLAPAYFYAALGYALQGSWEAATQVMTKAAWLADDDQRAGGAATIDEVTELHSLDSERMSALSRILSEATSDDAAGWPEGPLQLGT
jgi:hypothetical protein